MNLIRTNKLMWAAGGLLICFLLIGGSNLLVDRISENVIEKLQKEYTPGPYAPGFDPDKVDPNLWRQQPYQNIPMKQMWEQ